MKKLIFIASILVLPIVTQAQEKFEKDGKWGISKNGDGGKEDSIIFRADYDEIEDFVTDKGYFFTGKRNDEWYPLTSNKIVNQQRYESITVYEFASHFAVCLRDGYIDLIDIDKEEFLIRGVQATEIIDYDLSEAPNTLISTQNEKLIGAVNVDTKKEIFKAKYSSIKLTDTRNVVPYLTYIEGKNGLHDSLGNLKFSIETESEIMKFESLDDIALCYIMTNEKGLKGYYEVKNKWQIPMEYESIKAIDPGKSDIIVVKGKKGKGLYFEGNLLVDPSYTEILISDQRGYLAILIDKKGKEYYLNPEGKISAK